MISIVLVADDDQDESNFLTPDVSHGIESWKFYKF